MNQTLIDLIAEEVRVFRGKRVGDRVGVVSSAAELLSSIDVVLPLEGDSEVDSLRALIAGVEDALLHSVSPRYFGFVLGGSTPVSVAADCLTSVWDQNAQVYATSPAAALIEDVVAKWVLDLLGLPEESGVGFVSGAQMANFVALNSARNSVLADHSWDVARGLQGAPRLNVVCGAACHGSVHSALRMMGLGSDNLRSVEADQEGRIRIPELRDALEEREGPTILVLQAGNVNSGAFDDLEAAIDLGAARRAWVHVDGAFGLWARASARHSPLASGVERADSWAVDAHKWLNVPYDSGLVIVRDAAKHESLKSVRCAYAGESREGQRDGSRWTPDNSRRARGFVLYAALRNLGRQGVETLIDRCCEMARIAAEILASMDSVRVLNDVVLNQVLFRIEPPGIAELDQFNEAVATRLQDQGRCWMGTSRWQDMTVIRMSISNHATDERAVVESMESLSEVVSELRGKEA